MANVIQNPYIGRTDGLKFAGRKFDGEFDKDIVEFYEKDIIKKTGEKNDDFIIEKEVVEYQRYSRDEYIKSFSDDVGVLNILKKISLGGTDVEQFRAKPGFVDLTMFPEDFGAAQALSDAAAAAWSSIPDEIKAKMNYEEFVKSVDSEKILADYYAKKTQAQEPEKKEGEE